MNLRDILKSLMTKRVSQATTILFIITIMALSYFQGNNESDTRLESPDLSFIYSTDDLYKMAENYGQDGRISYVQTRFTFDLIFPIVYGIFLVSNIGWMFYPTKYMGLVAIPIIGVVFDYLENISTSLVMWRYPESTPIFDVAATFFTPLKWIALTLGFMVLIIGIMRKLYMRLSTH